MSALCKTCDKLAWDLYGEALASSHSSDVPSLSSPPLRNNTSFLSWYGVQTRYRAEKKVAAQLGKKGLETYLPVIAQTHTWSDRRKLIEVPLFSGYVFLRMNLSKETLDRVLKTQGFIRLVSFGGEAAPIPSKQIEDLRRLLASKSPCTLHAFLKVGQRVRIRGGCLDGLEGILAESTKKKLVISIACIKQAVAVQIDGYQLELV
ncbi:MAG TPA: UpxY family transcription antiterminator [Terriglobales bacterium]|jgi:transcription antitermination factor NusG